MDAKTLESYASDVDWKDVQGLVIRGYKRLDGGRYVFLKIKNIAATKAWIEKHGDSVHSTVDDPAKKAVNVAFSAGGLAKLGVPLDSFSPAFSEGMVMPHRSRILGDFGPNDPSVWIWGSHPDNTPDVLLALFGNDQSEVDDLYALLVTAHADAFDEMFHSDADLPTKGEHFGFKDGVSQPLIAGAPKRDGGTFSGDTAVGEFVLGYLNGRGEKYPIPSLGAGSGEQGSPFGMNGTYVVFRQMEQNVREFRDYCEQTGAALGEGWEWVASRIVGRSPNGEPLNGKDPFNFGSDPDGLVCPLGAHIRRSNPRDSLRNPGEPMTDQSRADSLHTVSHHRIMRRSRLYGPVFDPNAPDDNVPRGLHFMCLNASIPDAFELVQQTWVSSTKFAGLYDEVDPLVGIAQDPTGACSFTVQREPARLRLDNIPRFVLVRGGAYFFAPGKRALSMLARLPK